MRLSASGIHVVRGGRLVVSGVDLEAPEGSVVGLVGPNGSGKSSLLRTLYRSMKPRSGIVKVDEVNVWDDLLASIGSTHHWCCGARAFIRFLVQRPRGCCNGSDAASQRVFSTR